MPKRWDKIQGVGLKYTKLSHEAIRQEERKHLLKCIFKFYGRLTGRCFISFLIPAKFDSKSFLSGCFLKMVLMCVCSFPLKLHKFISKVRGRTAKKWFLELGLTKARCESVLCRRLISHSQYSRTCSCFLWKNKESQTL